MRLSEFSIGNFFYSNGSRWQCTDIGTRVVIAIRIANDTDTILIDGPPYSLAEFVFDENDLKECSITKGLQKRPVYSMID